MAIPKPMMKEEASSTGYVCMQANNVVPINGIRKPKNNTGFSPKRSIISPAGIDMIA
ncbi:unknown [Bacteroides clarus CAG:160]|nr:unknown [Bacteroides clarus CAG:160]